VLGWLLEDSGEQLVQTLRHSALTQVMHKKSPDAAAQVSTTRETLVALIVRRTTVTQALADGRLRVVGDASCVAALFEMLDDFALQFDVVTPGPARSNG
jgi:alkyl sulfatase BDS1-like metallo-beta-lactamase superfamily hydrolase